MHPSLLQQVLKKATANGKIFCTREQLYYAYLRDTSDEAIIRSAPLGAVAWLAAFLSAVFLIENKLHKLYAFLLAGAVHFVALMVYRNVLRPCSFQKFTKAYEDCEEMDQYKDMVLDVPAYDQDGVSYPGRRAEQYDRVMVVEEDMLVDFLVANGFHKTTRTLVVSLSGYPARCDEMVRKIMQQDNKEPVLFLHHARQNPRKMLKEIQTFSHAFPGSRPIVPLGVTHKYLKEYSQIPRAWRRRGEVYTLNAQMLLKDITRAVEKNECLDDQMRQRIWTQLNTER
jgi:hypothetical protein